MWLARLLLVVGAAVVLGSCVGNREERFERFLELGNEYHEKGLYAEASIMYRKALQEDRRSAEAWYRLALNSLGGGEFGVAGSALLRACELDPGNLDAFRKLADLHFVALDSPIPVRPYETMDNLIQITERAEARDPDAFEVLYVKGRILRQQGENEAAVELLSRAQRANPADMPATIALGKTLMDLNRYKEGEELVKPLFEVDEPAPEAFDLWYVLLVRQRRYDEALDVLLRKCEQYPKSAENWVLLAHFYRGTGNEAGMKEALQHLLDDTETFPAGHFRVGSFYLMINNPEAALNHYREGLASDQESANLYRQGLVRAHVAKGELDLAAQELDALLDLDPTNPAAHGLRGLLALRSRDPARLEEATSDLEMAVTQQPENYLLRYYLALAYRARGNEPAARAQLREAIQLNQNFIPTKYSLIEIHLANQEFVDAEVLARQILDLRPMDTGARLRLAAALIGLKELDRAREEVKILQEQGVSPSLVAFRKGQLELASGRLAEAARSFREALQANPKNEMAAQALLGVELDRRRFEEAEKLVRNWTSDTSPGDLQVLLARVALARGDQENATTLLREALDDDPDHVTAHLHLGNVLMLKGQLPAASTHFQQVIELGEQEPRAYFGYGTVLLTEGKYTEAQEVLQQAVTLAPDYPEALNNLAWTLAENGGDLGLALTYAQRAVARRPDNPDFADTLAYVYLKRDLNEDAVKVLNKLVREHPNRGTFRYHLGLAHYQRGDFESARRELEAAGLHQLSPEMRRVVAQLLTEIGG